MSNSNYSFSAVLSFINQHFLIFLIAIIALVIGFTGGSIWGKNQVLGVDLVAPSAPNAQPGQAPRPTKGVTTVDDDPILGDKDAPVTIVEFSDYECPFCKKFFDNTLPQIKKEYIDTGKVRLVYRDLPLSFHDPLATKEAIASNCAREQGGDAKFFEYHDEIFNRTASNGNGLTDADLDKIAADLGLNSAAFSSCLADPAQEEEVKQDVAAAGQAGATGTPTFVIGKTTADGQVEGELVVGAQPLSAFQAIIDPLLE